MTASPDTAIATTGSPSPRFRHIEPNPLRDVHKGIRAALFAVTAQAGRVDPADDLEVAALESELRDVAKLLADHARHEDDHVDLSALPAAFGEQIARDHEQLEARLAWLVELADAARLGPAGDRRRAIHELYVELASFTAAYLLHQDVEERIVLPILFERFGADGVVAIHDRIVDDMAPDERTRGMVAMFPAINVDDRCEMLAAMRSAMPPEAFAGVWSLAASVLADHDAAAVASRLGL